MLVLSRKLGEEIVIANNVRVRVVAIHGTRVQLAIAAPPEIPIQRAEIHRTRQEFQPNPDVIGAA